MICKLSELMKKDVINTADGARLGSVCDLEVDTDTARVKRIVIKGRFRLFGLLGRFSDKLIEWDNIKLIGVDTIFVECREEREYKKREQEAESPY